MVIAPGSSGYVTAFADGAARPTTSDLNFLAGQTLADQVYAPVGADGAVDFYNGSRSALRLIADVSGYFATQAAVAGGFVSTTPTRLLDTRSSFGGTAPAGRSTLHLQVLGRGPVPASGVSAVAFTLTALRPTASGSLTAYADGTNRPQRHRDRSDGHRLCPGLGRAHPPGHVDAELRPRSGRDRHGHRPGRPVGVQRL